MDWNVVSGLCVESVEGKVKCLDIVIHSGPGHSGYRDYTYSVLVAELKCLLDVESWVFLGNRNSTHFDLPELAEFFPNHLIGCAHHEIRLVIRLAFGFSALAPSKPCCNSTEHTCL